MLLKYLTQYLGLDDHLVSVLNMLKNVQAYLNRLIDFLSVVIAIGNCIKNQNKIILQQQLSMKVTIPFCALISSIMAYLLTS